VELRHIHSFLSLAKNLSFSHTAQIVHLTQPALSLQIQALEKEIGVTLFERNRRKTVLTPAGIAFQREAASGLLQLDQAMRSARLAANGKLGVVRLGFVSTAGTHMVPRLIREYRPLCPQVEFSLRNVLTADQGRMLEEGSLDVGFLRMPFIGGPEIEVMPIHTEQFVIVVPASHPLAKKPGVRLSETADEAYVLYERAHAPGFHDLVLGILHQAGVIPGIIQVAGEMPTLIALIASGAGISLLPASAVKISTAAVVACKIRDKIPTCEIGLAWCKKPSSPTVDRFRNFAVANARMD
jgi:DNA-binding transcriptional LysR family regulator